MDAQNDRQRLASLLSALSGGRRGEKEAELLLARCGSFSAVLEAHPALTARCARLTGAEAALLSALPGIARRCACERFGPSPVLNSPEAAAAYAQALYTGVRYERFEMLCLDGGLRLTGVSTLSEGSVRETGFYPRLMLDALVRTGAENVLLCHNHPSGRPYFSEADVSSTREAARILSDLGIALVDHLLIAAGGVHSMRLRRYLDEALWRHPWP